MAIDIKTFDGKGTAPASGDYVYGDDLVRAIKVAMVTGRPLLLRGAPGCGKTTLAKDLARRFERVFFQQVVTSRTEARDLEWHFDAVRRLGDAQLASSRTAAAPAAPAAGDALDVADTARYVEPQVLWWGFDPASARTRGGARGGPPPTVPEGARRAEDDGVPAVVLVDEIDKAEPELANDLLEPFDRGGFTVAETGHRVGRERDVFLVVTTNEARDLPAAFLRRCVVFELDRPKDLVPIAIAHHGADIGQRVDLDAVLKELGRFAEQAKKRGLREPGTAEFLDTVRAWLDLDLRADHPDWEAVARLTLWKHPAKELEGA